MGLTMSEDRIPLDRLEHPSIRRAVENERLWSAPARRAYIPQGVDQQGRLEPTIEPKREHLTSECPDDGDEVVGGVFVGLGWAILLVTLCVLAVIALAHLVAQFTADGPGIIT
jgi:hypothetical protein